MDIVCIHTCIVTDTDVVCNLLAKLSDSSSTYYAHISKI